MKKLIEIFIALFVVLAFSLCALTAQATVIPPPEPDICTLEEGLDLPDVVWETGGVANWFCQSEDWVAGGSAAQSGKICDGGTSWLQTTITVSEMKLFSFQWKIAPEQPEQLVDTPAGMLPSGSPCPRESSLTFFVDDCEKGSIKPGHGWDQKVICLSPGTHTLRWEFAGDDGIGCPESSEPADPDCDPPPCPPCPAYAGRVDSVEIVDPPSVNLMKHYLGTYPQPCSVDPQFVKNRVAKAIPDEVYEGDPKVNQAYVWSLTRSGNLWFGTVANTPCWVMGLISAATGMGGSLPMFETQNLVCEFGESANGLGPLGDWRPPQIFEYDPLTMTVVDRTPLGMMDPDNATLGLRSAGALDGVVLLAGQSLDGQRINMFAFLDDGTYLGMHVMEEYNDIRHTWVVLNDNMYVGVKTTDGDEGRILRWTGNSSNPFQFEVVGSIDLQAANMTVHRNRLYVTTWPVDSAAALGGSAAEVGLWRSPEIPTGGYLTGSDNESWEKVWKVSDYEPDPIMQRVYAGGALASLNGTLFWGTMHVPFLGTAAALMASEMSVIDLGGVDGEFGPDDITALALGTHRATSVFSSTFESPQTTVELLYGDEYLPVYDNESRSYTIAYDDKHRNNMENPKPKFGPAGICSYFNAYTWTMERGFINYPNRGGLLLGTFDSSFLARDVAGTMLQGLMPDCADCGESALEVFLSVLDELYNKHAGGYGADLYVIRSADEPFILDSKDGAGNYLNYGIRTMLMPAEPAVAPDVPEGPAMIGEETCPQGYLGTANPFNLADEGGWELIQIHPMPEIAVVSPTPGQFVIGALTLKAQDLSICPLVSAEFVITDINDQNTVYGPASNAGGGLWEYPLDTTQLPNGIYYAVARGSDADGGMAESDPIPFVAANECSQDSDCDDGLFCTVNESCEQGMCVAGTDPCVGEGKVCSEDIQGCVQCVSNADCEAGYECDGLANACAVACPLNVWTKGNKPIVPKPNKPKNVTLFVSGLEEGFTLDPFGVFDLGPFGWKKAKVKVKKGVLKISVIVPAGLAPGNYEIRFNDCIGEVMVSPMN